MIRRLRLPVLVAVVVGVSLAHYLTPVGDHVDHAYHADHALYQWFFHLPIILAGFWFGFRGGTGFGALVTVLYVPHVLVQWHGGTPEQWLEIALYNIVGWVVGILAEGQKAHAEKYRKAAHALDDAYLQLKDRTAVLLETEEHLRRADRLTALGQLSAGLAHEIKTPLSSIRGAADILSAGTLEDGEHGEFLGILIRETDRLNRVVGRFLDFARPAQERRESASVASEVEAVFDLLRVEVRRQGVELRSDLPGDLPPVAIDGEQLRQVVLNLVMNGIQAMEGAGAVTVTTRTTAAGRIEMEVRDTGPGIPPELLPHVFDPFVTGRRNGTGLGLSIVHRILANHGAEIRIDSDPPYGTGMIVDLPVAPEVARG